MAQSSKELLQDVQVRQLLGLWLSTLKNCLNVGYKHFAVPCLVWVTSTSMSSSCAISPAIYQKGQHQLRWSQVLWLHYHINNPSDYKWSVVAASDIAATAHCKEEEKKFVFQLQKNSSHPDIWEHWGSTNGAVMALQLTSSHNPMVNGQMKDKPALSLTWRPKSDWAFLFKIQLSEVYVSWKHSAFRAAHTLLAVQVRLCLL